MKSLIYEQPGLINLNNAVDALTGRCNNPGNSVTHNCTNPGYQNNYGACSMTGQENATNASKNCQMTGSANVYGACSNGEGNKSNLADACADGIGHVNL